MTTIHRPHFAVAAVAMLWPTRLITRPVDLTGAVGLTTVTTVHPSASMVAITVLAAAASATTDSAAKLPFVRMPNERNQPWWRSVAPRRCSFFAGPIACPTKYPVSEYLIDHSRSFAAHSTL